MDEQIPLPSDRKFGLLFVIVSLVVAVLQYRHGHSTYIVFVAIAALLLLVSFAWPSILRPANRAWMALGLLLSKIVSPIVLGVLFFVVFTPLSVLMKAFGRDALRRKKDPSSSSYWVLRSPPGPDPGSMRDQG